MYTRKKNFFKNDNEIDLTSLIDVVFLILIFFMITSTFVKEKDVIKVELAKVKTAEKQKHSKDALVIVITKEGKYAINEDKDNILDRNQLYDELKIKSKGHELAVIKGDQNAPFQSYVYLEDVLSELNINKRSILVKSKEK